MKPEPEQHLVKRDDVGGRFPRVIVEVGSLDMLGEKIGNVLLFQQLGGTFDESQKGVPDSSSLFTL